MNAEQIQAAEAEIAAAKQVLQQKLIDAEAARRPLAALAGIEGYLIHLPEAMAAEFAALIEKSKTLIG